MKAKQKRKLALIASLATVGGAFVYLLLGTFQDSLVYFYTPSEVMASTVNLEERKFRLAGQVDYGSIQQGDTRLEINFTMTDGTHTIPVQFTGIIPDLFAEGQMAVAEGRMVGDTFHANLIMAKHSEDYDPDEMSKSHATERAPEKW